MNAIASSESAPLANYANNLQRGCLPIAVLVIAVGASSCTTTPESGAKPPPLAEGKAAAAPAAGVDDALFSEAAERIYWQMMESDPQHAVELGYHDYDGRIPNFSPEAIKADRARAVAARDQLKDFDPARLSSLRRVEREVLLAQLEQSLFSHGEMNEPARNPLLYRLEVSSYISRPYAPAAERARAIISVATQAPAFFKQAQANLDEVLPKTWVRIAMMMTKGTVSFVKDDVPKALGDLGDPALQAELTEALAGFATALTEHAAFLEKRLAKADDSYALGEEKFLRMLKVVNGVEIDLATLQRVADDDLTRNLAAMEAAAKKIDSAASTEDVVARVLADKPAADQVLAEATQQCDELRKHLSAHAIVTIPSTDVAVLKETPPFLRFNFAFLDGAGPFEKQKLESFYYITPPDPAWPKEQQDGYIPGKTDLLGTSIHEVWPGHFLHGLHRKKTDSVILKSFWSYAMGEGWAHYVEEMMITDGGYRSDEPSVRVGQLVNALLRNVRFVSAIGLHTGTMTMDESLALFKTKGFQDEGNAQQQAVRGTFDPMYLSYTIGKLMILKLKDDHKKLHGDGWTLQKFHDELLSYGTAPLPVIRREMLGANAGPAL